MNKLNELEAQRDRLTRQISNFRVHPKKEVTPPPVVKVIDGHRELAFHFDDGKCAETPPNWGWAKGYSYRDLLQYFEVHRYHVVLP